MTFKSLLKRWQPNEPVLLGGAALCVGLTAGAGIWLFKRLIDWAQWLFFGRLGGCLHPLGEWTILLLPILGGVIVGLVTHFLIGEERHHGVAGIMEAVALAGGRLRYKRTPAKIAAAALSIGSGASVGPEDPSVQIGASAGSMFGQWFRLSEDWVRTLAAAGSAAGIAAAFNAPIAGVFFALEVILGEIGGNALGVVVLAGVISSVFTQAVSGPQPAFQVPAYAFNSPLELPLYLGLGLLAGPLAVLYIRLLYLFRDGFHRLERIPQWIRPALAGGIVGLVGVFLPQVFGVGYETIEAIFRGEALGLGLLLVLMVAKLVLTPLSIGGGFMGGVFAPSLFIGATLGAAYGGLAAQAFPSLQIVPAAFAMVGMAALLAGAVHAPLTAILLLFEMTHDYRIILPLMFAVVVSLLIARRVQSDSVYTLSLARKGIRLERGRDVEVLETITVGEVMQPAPKVLRANEMLTRAAEVFQQTHHHGLPVVDEAGWLMGVLTLQDLDAAAPESWAERTVGASCSCQPLTAYPDETLGTVLRRMSAKDVGRLPVVDRDNPRRLLGLLRRTDLVRAYDIALTRRASLRHRVQQVRLGASVEEAGVFEVLVEAGASCDGKRVNDIAWPHDSLIASLRRGRQSFIPRGETLLQAGDVLLVVAEGHTGRQVRELCTRQAKEG